MNNILKNAARELYEKNDIKFKYDDFEESFEDGVIDYVLDVCLPPRDHDLEFAYMEGVKFAEENEDFVFGLYS